MHSRTSDRNAPQPLPEKIASLLQEARWLLLAVLAAVCRIDSCGIQQGRSRLVSRLDDRAHRQSGRALWCVGRRLAVRAVRFLGLVVCRLSGDFRALGVPAGQSVFRRRSTSVLDRPRRLRPVDRGEQRHRGPALLQFDPPLAVRCRRHDRAGNRRAGRTRVRLYRRHPAAAGAVCGQHQRVLRGVVDHHLSNDSAPFSNTPGR